MHRPTIALSLLLGCWRHPAPEPPTAAATAARPATTDDLARATYHASADLVFAKTLEVVRDKYENVEPYADARAIKTAWHQFVPGTGGDTGVRYFARFDVEIDGPPYAIAITPHVAGWRAGESVPRELSDRRDWLAETIVGLRARIDRKLARYRTR